ncbi:hypothetical protein Mterra_01883 [Calidithermus terrae]|uniref:Uncharacterized protein n=1 Tax=Calidithermus terrae TaxID=1408545 RepID=A0A399EMH6_9DEIN|nr:hypothetical protein [Calidithermus terrae]RIH84703.1 hypothetical protein Mterra_01883 [Calidithermus terrae]
MKRLWLLCAVGVFSLAPVLAGFSVYESGFPVISKAPYPGKVLVQKAGSGWRLGVPWGESASSLAAMHVSTGSNDFWVYWEDGAEPYSYGMNWATFAGVSQGRVWFTAPSNVLSKGCYGVTLLKFHQRTIISRAYRFCL